MDVKGKRAVGGLVYRRTWSRDDAIDVDVLECSFLAVASNRRGRGIAGRLVKLLLERAAAERCVVVTRRVGTKRRGAFEMHLAVFGADRGDAAGRGTWIISSRGYALCAAWSGRARQNFGAELSVPAQVTHAADSAVGFWAKQGFVETSEPAEMATWLNHYSDSKFMARALSPTAPAVSRTGRSRAPRKLFDPGQKGGARAWRDDPVPVA